MAKPNTHGIGAAFAKRRKAPAKAPLDRERVIAAAVKILDAEGPGALTFRRLAADLDAGVATLYWHVDNKEMLLDLVLDAVMDELGEGFDAHPELPWDERMRGGLIELWRLMRRHPWAALHAISTNNRGPNLLHHWDRGAALLFTTGMEARDVFYALSTLFTFVVGVGVQDAIWHVYGVTDQSEARAAELGEVTRLFDELPADAYPTFRRILPVFASHDEDEQFLSGIDLLLAGIRGQLAANG
ncbi:Tetracycline repressor protein class H [Baekduia alba]|uniref:TetR/AcrR family transcriptional regulator C-terminal domain-containing protein n=1 Tax=Baekduia alba TaxID=2997333 RepID=UPI00233F800B|nr:TetR/AcrR family transcriptional regulator C-terminal domain-containing protein [Baekduia alba]WCB93558.1 Tetracycline repressor protein class H [Baekduia alba]